MQATAAQQVVVSTAAALMAVIQRVEDSDSPNRLAEKAMALGLLAEEEAATEMVVMLAVREAWEEEPQHMSRRLVLR